MSQAAEKLKTVVLGLPTEDRAELAYCLLRSLDEEDAGGIQSPWEAELERRWQEMEIGKVTGRPSDEVFADTPESRP
ncbi:MAG: addiction module protein [Thermoguttaceae bacterium]|jgi:putative addiction module component (TIGR02574 family)